MFPFRSSTACSLLLPTTRGDLQSACTAATKQSLSSLCRARLAPYKVPRQWKFVDAIPRNSMGKVLKGELRSRFGSVGA